uniref:Uncharacterized protein n=1 Tax=Romanomermis culicivorax TaxID=13658 RepID=A0A915HSL3_ROMCU
SRNRPLDDGGHWKTPLDVEEVVGATIHHPLVHVEIIPFEISKLMTSLICSSVFICALMFISRFSRNWKEINSFPAKVLLDMRASRRSNATKLTGLSYASHVMQFKWYRNSCQSRQRRDPNIPI